MDPSNLNKINQLGSPYTVLGITEGAGPEEIKKAYRKLALQYHPDKCGLSKKECEDKFKEIGWANEFLANPEKMALYKNNLLSAQQNAAQDVRFTGKTEMSNGMTYNQVTNGKETWWEDLNGETYWEIPRGAAKSSANVGIQIAKNRAAEINARKAAFNAMFKGGSRTRRFHRKTRARRTRKRSTP